ncbi:prepilin peptidase [Kitasatospora sp. NPDC056783]|uniref:prepilin peptidase n=1 Tax=Kitasatospora sp. NPDC056783 TaxID=3345943 RepID=UPI0036BA6128
MASLTALVTAAVAGGVTGWALRPTIARLAVPDGQPWSSSCAACQKRFTWRSGPALSPRGRCGCGARLGAAPLIPELIAAGSFTALVAVLGVDTHLLPALWLAACGTPLAVIDTAVQRLPNPLTGTAAAGTAIILLALTAASGSTGPLLRAGIGAAVLGLVFFLFALAPSNGYGDAKLAPTVGAVLGWYGWIDLVHGVAAAFFLFGAYAATLLTVFRSRGRRDASFGPAMLTGALLAVLVNA